MTRARSTPRLLRTSGTVREHGEGWDIENYVPEIAGLGILVAVPV